MNDKFRSHSSKPAGLLGLCDYSYLEYMMRSIDTAQEEQNPYDVNHMQGLHVSNYKFMHLCI